MPEQTKGNDEEIDVELDDEDLDDDDTSTDDDDDKTDWKAEAARLKGINQRYKTKLERAKQSKAETKTEIKKETKGEMDYGQKAFLRAEGIKGEAELALVKEYMASGKDLESIIENKHFQNDLKDLREEKTTKDAIPSTSKRSSSTSRDKVDYWIAKGELPPVEDVELRRQVVNAKANIGKPGGNFYNSGRK